MATTEPVEPVTTADVHAALDQVEKLIRDWRARLPVDGSDPEPGVAREAARVAGTAEGAVRKAACDMRAISERTTGVPMRDPFLRVISR